MIVKGKDERYCQENEKFIGVVKRLTPEVELYRSTLVSRFTPPDGRQIGIYLQVHTASHPRMNNIDIFTRRENLKSHIRLKSLSMSSKR
jgi:hypothetical protein